jgi:hypothetical protein
MQILIQHDKLNYRKKYVISYDGTKIGKRQHILTYSPFIKWKNTTAPIMLLPFADGM